MRRMKAKQIRNLRKRLGLKQEEFAELLGTTQESVSRFELKRRIPSKSIAILLEQLRKNGRMRVE